MNEPAAQSAAAIRRRPGMYIGDVHDGSGLAHMIWEVVANSVDEHLAGACSRISVEIDANGRVTATDDGRGFPLALVDGLSLAERALTTFHTTPTLDRHAPHAHVGAHGVGIFIVCALSSSLELEFVRDGRSWWQSFAAGHATSPRQDRGQSQGRGTRLTFHPDSAIFGPAGLDSSRVLKRLTELSFLLPGLTLHFADRREHVLSQPGGLAGHLAATSQDKPFGPTFTLATMVDDILIEVAARWSPYARRDIQSFANTERTTDGGTHVQGLVSGLAEGLKRAAPSSSAYSAARRVAAVSSNMRALVCVRLDDPSYDAPTKSILSTPRVRQIVREAVAQSFAAFLAHEPDLLVHLQGALR